MLHMMLLTKYLHDSFISLAQLSGFRFEFPEEASTWENYFHSIKEACTISRNDKSITLSLEELNDLENEIVDYIEFRLTHIMNKSARRKPADAPEM